MVHEECALALNLLKNKKNNKCALALILIKNNFLGGPSRHERIESVENQLPGCTETRSAGSSSKGSQQRGLYVCIGVGIFRVSPQDYLEWAISTHIVCNDIEVDTTSSREFNHFSYLYSD